jgi:hypothetical protein
LGRPKILLASAQELIGTLTSDPTFGRVLRALARLPPDDREPSLRRSSAARRFGASRQHRAHQRDATPIHPNPRLFVRVLDPTTVDAAGARSGRRAAEVFGSCGAVHLVHTRGEGRWQPVVAQAVRHAVVEDLEACVALMHDVIELVTPASRSRTARRSLESSDDARPSRVLR